MSKFPAFQFYPKDWLSSRRVRLMNAEQRGWYIQLLCEAWESEVQGTLPYNLNELWILAGAPNEQVFNTCSSPVLAMFELKGDTLIHHRLVKEVIKQKEWSQHCSQAGKRSGAVRRQKLKDQHLANTNTCSVSVPTESQPEPQPKVNIADSRLQIADCTEVLNYLNTKTGRKYQPINGNIKFIVARMKEGVTKETLKAVIDMKCKKWLNDPKMSEYLRPQTLFNAEKFAGYSGEIGIVEPEKNRTPWL